jgi:hypothetical protein
MGMNNLYTRGSVGQQTPGGLPVIAPSVVRQRPSSQVARQQQRWPLGKRYRWMALVHIPSRGT